MRLLHFCQVSDLDGALICLKRTEIPINSLINLKSPKEKVQSKSSVRCEQCLPGRNPLVKKAG